MIKISDPKVLIMDMYKKILISGFSLEIYNFPGHTNGSCVIKYENNIFTGDTIFKQGVFINKLPGENVEKLKQSILEIFQTFDSNSICFPGHGSDATLDYIKLKNHDLINFINN
jgi:glyoxylase-like metal-dependent hydrolase (beta-lactamase superfamily II)